MTQNEKPVKKDGENLFNRLRDVSFRGRRNRQAFSSIAGRASATALSPLSASLSRTGNEFPLKPGKSRLFQVDALLNNFFEPVVQPRLAVQSGKKRCPGCKR
jgi:hypothetical protein